MCPAYLTTHLEVDWLEDGARPMAAWNINRGVLPNSREARFRVYGASDDPRAGTSFGRAGTETLEFIWTIRPPKISYVTRFTLKIPRRS